MTPWQKVLLTFVSVWMIGTIVGAPYTSNIIFSIAMCVGIAIHENIHVTLWNKFK